MHATVADKDLFKLEAANPSMCRSTIHLLSYVGLCTAVDGVGRHVDDILILCCSIEGIRVTLQSLVKRKLIQSLVLCISDRSLEHRNPEVFFNDIRISEVIIGL